MTYDVNTPSVARLWPHHPDWSAGYDLTRSFLTDVAKSRNNTEQRRALRDKHRLSARYSTALQDDGYRAARHFLRAWQNKPAAVPDFSRYQLTTGSSSGGGSTLTMTSPPAWVAAGQLAVLCDTDTSELVEIASVAGSTINLEEPLANAWPSGSILRPVLHGLLSGQLQSSRYRRSAAELAVTIAAYPGGEPPESEGAAETTFNGYEVFPAIEPNWQGAPSLEYLWPVEQIDFGIGRTAQFRPIDAPQSLTESEYAGLAPSDARSIEQAFLRAKGRRGAFYRPTTEKDFILAADASGTSFLAEGSDLADDFGSTDFSEEPAAVEIVQANGTRLHRSITDIAASGGNSQVTLNASVTITEAGTARISWMPLVRFASDDLTTRWQTPVSAAIRATFQSIRA